MRNRGRKIMKKTVKKNIRIFLLLNIAVLFIVSIEAADGDLDTTFNSSGVQLTRLGDGYESLNAVAIQVDGKIVGAGEAGNHFVVARYNTDGKLDTTFGGDGVVLTKIENHDAANALAIQVDGKIIIAGYSFMAFGKSDFVAVRYNPNGSLDTTFDGDGIVKTTIGTNDNQARAIAIQPDGKILLAGFAESGTNTDFAVVRYNSNGSLDTTFDSDGKVTTPIGTSSDLANSIELQPDGKIVLGGQSHNGSNFDFAFARYKTNGSLDTAFGGDGQVTVAIGAGLDIANSVAIQADGKIVAAGYSDNGLNDDFALIRLSSVGVLDTNFNLDGKVITAIGTGIDRARSISIQSDGKILAVGHSLLGSAGYFTLVRYKSNGVLDTAFNIDGIVTTQIGLNSSVANSVALQLDGKIIAAGRANTSNTDFGIARYNTDGSLDTSFNLDGKVITEQIDSNARLDALAIQSNGKIVTAGTSNTTGSNDYTLARYNANGSLDTSFDGDGKVITAVGFGPLVVTSLAVQSDGKILVGSTAHDITILRYNANGTIDTTFDGDGKVITPIGISGSGVYSLAIQSDGKILAAGYSNNISNLDFAVVRYNTNGSLDTSFDGDGIVTTQFGEHSETARAIAIQADGKIVVAGFASVGTSLNDFAIARFNSNGGLDTSFDSDGKVITAIGTNSRAHSIAIQSDGKIVIAGVATTPLPFSNDFALARYNQNGILDTTFGGDGKITTSLGPRNDYAESIKIQSDGKILAAGYTENSISLNSDFAIVRYNRDGSLDGSLFTPNSLNLFGSGGIVTTDISPPSSDFATSMALQPDGKIVLGGHSDGYFCVARYQNSLAPTAATATINGRITTANGRSIRNVSLSLTDTTTGENRSTITNPFGYYHFQDLEVGRSYVLSVKSKRFTFANPSRLITLDEDLTGEDFTAEEK
jgi:uncharacterized delta-60 repeat protein